MIYPFVWGYYGMGFPFIVRWNDKISLRISKAAFLRPETTLCSPLRAAGLSHRWQFWWHFQRNPNHKSLTDGKQGPMRERRRGLLSTTRRRSGHSIGKLEGLAAKHRNLVGTSYWLMVNFCRSTLKRNVVAVGQLFQQGIFSMTLLAR
jgi:hypothetical protein